MKRLTLIIMLAAAAFGQEASAVRDNIIASGIGEANYKAPPAEVHHLRAENEFLKAQLAQISIELAYQLKVCQMPDLMKARLAVLELEQKKIASEPKAKP